jgi:hypothetical protein
MAEQLLQVAKIVETQLDAELERLDNLGDDDLERIRKNRIEAMRNLQKQKIEWQQLGKSLVCCQSPWLSFLSSSMILYFEGHGEYSEVGDEREFFEICKKSKHVVCHFYRESTFRCKIFDKHLSLIAKQHIEAKFIKVNVEKLKFLTERLRVRTIPSIALIRDNKPIDYIVGFTDLGNVDDFDTEMLEWRIATQNIIDYNGDLVNPPINGKKKKAINNKPKSTIRDNKNNNDSDDDES